MDLYKDQLKKPHTSVVECDFDGYFDQQMRELEDLTDKGAQTDSRSAAATSTLPFNSDTGGDDVPPPIPGLLRGMCNSSSYNSAQDIS